jgi:hypothetical protein
MAAMSYVHLTELLETLDILSDTDFTAKLRQSLIQAEQGQTIPWDIAKAQLGLPSPTLKSESRSAHPSQPHPQCPSGHRQSLRG